MKLFPLAIAFNEGIFSNENSDPKDLDMINGP